MRLCGMAPEPSLSDLARAAFQPPAELLAFNPFLSKAALVHLQQGARVWLQLCVLSDRLSRLLTLTMAGTEAHTLLVQVSPSIITTHECGLARRTTTGKSIHYYYP